MPKAVGTLVLPTGTSFPGSPVEGQVCYRTDIEALFIYDGTNWQPLRYGWEQMDNLLMPADLGFQAWNFDPIAATTSVALNANGTLYFSRIPIRESFTAANLHVNVVTAGATLTANQCLGLLYNSAGTLIGRTANQATAWTSTGEKVMALTVEAGQSLALQGGPDSYVIGAVYANGTTRPALSRWDAPSSAPLANKNLTGNSIRHGTANTGITSTPPSALASQAAATWQYWMGLS